MIKIWDSAKIDRGGGAPIRTIKPQLQDKKPVQVSLMAGWQQGLDWEWKWEVLDYH